MANSSPATSADERTRPLALGTWVVNCDGASRGNPGEASIGCVIRDPAGEIRRRVAKRLGWATNNEAEYEATIAGLQAARELGARHVELRLDSELIVRQLEGRYRVRKAELRPRFERVMSLIREFDTFAVRHVRREQNREADALANLALDGFPPDAHDSAPEG
ncbi:MAG TPA: ribonuclease HI family protein [Dehalococcoidia bacterium]|nr:ribonuclease HI family protein [Dehalococcoidia bacterium]